MKKSVRLMSIICRFDRVLLALLRRNIKYDVKGISHKMRDQHLRVIRLAWFDGTISLSRPAFSRPSAELATIF